MKLDLILVLASVSASLAYGQDSGRSSDAPVPATMKLIGKIESKTYYEPANTEAKVNWIKAREQCEDAGLQLGSTVNTEEYSFIYDKRPRIDYWLSASLKGFGADMTIDKGFEWLDGTEFADSGIGFYPTPALTWLCVYLDGGDHAFADSCINAKHKVLCQKTE